MAINFDLNDLQAFRAVVEQGSFRKAADTVRLSQPALSRRIEKLEDALGVKLFERTTRKVSLTQAGRGFMPSVERLLDDLDVALLGISEVASTRLGHVTVACVPSAAYYFMPRVVARYHQQFPRIKVKVLDSSAHDVLERSGQWRGGFRFEFPGHAGCQSRFRTACAGVLCRRLPARSPVGRAQQRDVGRVLSAGLHLARQDVGQPLFARSGLEQRGAAASEHLRNPACDDDDWSGGGGVGGGGGAADGDARGRIIRS